MTLHAHVWAGACNLLLELQNNQYRFVYSGDIEINILYAQLFPYHNMEEKPRMEKKPRMEEREVKEEEKPRIRRARSRIK
jgi:hypothetical protein